MTLNRIPSLGLFAGLLLTLPALGCPAADDTNDTGADDGATGNDDGATAADDGATAADDGATAADHGVDSGSGDDGGAVCTGAGGTEAVGAACTSNEDCESGVCVLFGDVPTPTDAVCGDAPADCATRITGTVFDFETGARVGGIGVRVAQAVQAASNPAGATAIVEGTSDADGQFDQTSDTKIMSAIGIVALVENDEYLLTATGVASPDMAGNYNVGNSIHELWAVPKLTLTTWSDALAMDAGIPATSLPLGEQGGVVGIVRDATTGAPVTRALVVPASGDSASIVRYLADDQSWTEDGTGASGIFTIINPSLAENFHVEVDGATVSGNGTAGSAKGAIFTLIMNVTG